jgi:hypothetical protein
MLQPHGLLRAWRSFAGCALVHTFRCLRMRPEAVHLAVLGHCGMAHVCAQLTSGVVFALLYALPHHAHLLHRIHSLPPRRLATDS